MNTDNLFVKILNTTATTEVVMAALRELIFWEVVNNTAKNIRVDENTFECMKLTAENISVSVSGEFFCDGKIVENFYLTKGEVNHQLNTLRKLYDTISQYHAWYGDSDGDGKGFCWCYNSHQYRLIFK